MSTACTFAGTLLLHVKAGIDTIFHNFRKAAVQKPRSCCCCSSLHSEEVSESFPKSAVRPFWRDDIHSVSYTEFLHFAQKSNSEEDNHDPALEERRAAPAACFTMHGSAPALNPALQDIAHL
eukprot:1140045-Pelagomonas_calceolata.AAC.3